MAFHWGDGPQREFTARRLCPGATGDDPHVSRWWRWIDPDRRDGHWQCATCDWRAPEVTPTGEATDKAVTTRLPHGETAVMFPLLAERDLALAA